MGTVVIPAHNESAVIARTLEPLAELAERGVVEVIVACNGCTDDTADIARRIDGITVLETSAASKTGAMNAADDVAMFWPRIYLDADVTMTARAVIEIMAALTAPGALSARPPYRYDATRSSFTVRRYYDARSSIPSFGTHLWGAGCYALSEEGHGRIGRFPQVIADDVAVDALFADREKVIVHTDPTVVSVPRTTRALTSVLARNYRGNAGVVRTTDSGTSLRQLLVTVRGPASALNTAVYIAFALRGRRAAARHGDNAWARDDSSRR